MPADVPPGKPGSPRYEADRGAWWSIFQDPELDRLERQINLSNQNVKQYEAQYAQAVALLREAQSQLFPTLALSGGGQRGGGGGGTAAVSSTVGSGAGGSTHTSFTLEANIAWQPDIWGTVRRQIESLQEENALIGVAIGAYFPTVSLTGLGGFAGSPLSTLVRLPNRHVLPASGG